MVRNGRLLSVSGSLLVFFLVWLTHKLCESVTVIETMQREIVKYYYLPMLSF